MRKTFSAGREFSLVPGTKNIYEARAGSDYRIYCSYEKHFLRIHTIRDQKKASQDRDCAALRKKHGRYD